jgi:methylenetetrahydrofolate reductase (NADPH)
MKLSSAYGSGRFGLSFELFPPKTPQGLAALFHTTLEVVSRVRREFQLTVATHLTCVGRTVDQLCEYLREAGAQNVENVVALRGDPPRGDSTFRPVAGGLRYANELVTLIRREFPDLGVAVAGYPETHQEASSPQADLENLKRKVDAGADVVITQLFYDNDDFFRFRDRCQAISMKVPIVPGLLPVTNFAQIQRITTLCGAKLPAPLVRGLEAAGDDAERQFAVGVDFATRQTQALIDAGVPGIHFYVLNRSEAAAEVLGRVKFGAKLTQ